MSLRVYNFVLGASWLTQVWLPDSRLDQARIYALVRYAAAVTGVTAERAGRNVCLQMMVGMSCVFAACSTCLAAVIWWAVMFGAAQAEAPWWVFVLGVTPSVLLLTMLFLERRLRPAALEDYL